MNLGPKKESIKEKKKKKTKKEIKGGRNILPKGKLPIG